MKSRLESLGTVIFESKILIFAQVEYTPSSAQVAALGTTTELFISPICASISSMRLASESSATQKRRATRSFIIKKM